MLRKLALSLLACLRAQSHTADAHDSSNDERERALATLETMFELTLSISVYMTDESFYPVIDENSNIYEVLDGYIERTPLVDAWGTSFAITSGPESFTIVSAGADRAFQSHPGTGAPGSWDADIIVSNGSLRQWPAHAVEFQAPRESDCRETERRMRIVGAALELYRGAYESYPEARSIEELDRVLSPSFAGNLPTRDAWGSLFELDVTRQSWRLASHGCDRLPDHERSAIARLLPRDDIVRRGSQPSRPAACPGRPSP